MSEHLNPKKYPLPKYDLEHDTPQYGLDSESAEFIVTSWVLEDNVLDTEGLAADDSLMLERNQLTWELGTVLPEQNPELAEQVAAQILAWSWEGESGHAANITVKLFEIDPERAFRLAGVALNGESETAASKLSDALGEAIKEQRLSPETTAAVASWLAHGVYAANSEVFTMKNSPTRQGPYAGAHGLTVGDRAVQINYFEDRKKKNP